MVSAEELTKAQVEIHNKIDKLAKENGLTNERVAPILDGVYDADKYLFTSPRIMWVLKEPYDDFDSEGKPFGGGWPLYDAYDNKEAWKNPTWQPMIYVSYGIIHHKKWEEMDWIRDDLSMKDVLKQVAYINISKMPAYSNSKEDLIIQRYNVWRPILLEQVSVYKPDIIIFGNTFKYFKCDLLGEDAEPVKKIDGVVHVYEKDGVKLFDAYHPNQKIIGRDLYVNSIIESCI